METFSNEQIIELPSIRDLELQRPHSRYLIQLLLAGNLLLGILVVGGYSILLLTAEWQLPWRLLGYGAIAVWPLIMLYLSMSYRKMGYAVRERDVSVVAGVLFRRTVVQPLCRLQHIEISRGPLEHLLGLATLKLFSAGGATHSLAVPGLLVERADKLRGYILDNKALDDE